MLLIHFFFWYFKNCLTWNCIKSDTVGAPSCYRDMIRGLSTSAIERAELGKFVLVCVKGAVLGNSDWCITKRIKQWKFAISKTDNKNIAFFTSVASTSRRMPDSLWGRSSLACEVVLRSRGQWAGVITTLTWPRPFWCCNTKQAE